MIIRSELPEGSTTIQVAMKSVVLIPAITSFLVACSSTPDQPAPLQEDKPEVAFGKLEESILQAETLQLTFENVRVGAKGKEQKTTGSIVLKKGNKANVKVNLGRPGWKMELAIISDGKTMVVMDGPPGSPRMRRIATPAFLDKLFAISLSRLGAWNTALFISMSSFPNTDDKKVEDLRSRFPASKFEDAKSENGQKSIIFRCEAPLGKDIIDAQLWYDLESLKITKRVWTHKSGLKGGETYKTFTLGAQVPDETFTVPKEK